MNAIIALCHFCELHGPSVLFHTQAFHSREPQGLDAESGEESGSLASFLSSGRRSRSQSAASSTSSVSNTPKKSETCQACRSVPSGHPGFVSKDPDTKISYVSSQYPEHPQLFSIVRQACVRSLSCEIVRRRTDPAVLSDDVAEKRLRHLLLEKCGTQGVPFHNRVCPGREGPIFFGDDHWGHVFSHTFFIKDSQARGFQRWYSIIVVMMDKIYLINSWPFLVKHIGEIISKLQDKAIKVYDQEQNQCPERARRMNESFMAPGDFFRRQRGGDHFRPLVTLTKDDGLFKWLHQWFVWVLKAGGNRMTEKLLEGPPTEDVLIDMEKQEETEEGFIKINTKPMPSPDQPTATEELQQTSPPEAEEAGAEGDADSTAPVFTSLRHFRQIIGSQGFHSIAHHILIGNQIIIRGEKRPTMESIINVLKSLLPMGCCRIVPYSATYEDSWKCNFLGLPLVAQIPAHVMSSEYYVIIDVLSPAKVQQTLEPDVFFQYSFLMTTKAQLPEKGPAILQKIELALENENLSSAVVDACLVSLKEEWMNKVKVLFKFSRAGSRSREDTLKLLQVLEATEEDTQMLKFWMTGLSNQHRTHMLSSAISTSPPM
ncbi:folliculin-like isoform X1 [Branchiostoma floridae]|uniref:Folliculin n=1 Tax=Branchiostoma floridae TaxID=7739 RepID=A0A9J7M690_BRAFL|nr:folliculin-like isoform X1 [Branchiostoma floridae]